MNRDFLDAVSESVRISQQKWIEWQHEMKGIIHCGPCLALGKLYLFGQRLNIRVEIPRKDGRGVVSFITGWTARPHGEIKLNTPYGGS